MRATDGRGSFESYSRAVPGIERIHIKGFGCIEDVELELGPLQAFIGPNDSRCRCGFSSSSNCSASLLERPRPLAAADVGLIGWHLPATLAYDRGRPPRSHRLTHAQPV